ncbi:MAG: hypothetical protein M2R45_03899 [Verrucomicrobia subdivision 3 bacterium]|nr:hypothetical protein [Limisphaerales bacterium]MCS1412602.1 hypothetical protein [Limisphaerales bacterium]
MSYLSNLVSTPDGSDRGRRAKGEKDLPTARFSLDCSVRRLHVGSLTPCNSLNQSIGGKLLPVLGRKGGNVLRLPAHCNQRPDAIHSAASVVIGKFQTVTANNDMNISITCFKR